MAPAAARSVFSRLSPFGPIFRMELRTTSRRKRNYFLRVVYLGALLLFLLAVSASSSRNYGGAAMRAQAQAELGEAFFICFSIFSVVAMALIAPVVTSTAISGERLHKTFHVLLMTPITSWQIISGKLLSRLLTAFTLLGLSLPVLALVRLLGGVEISQMFGAIALAMSVAVFLGAFGLLMSTMINRAYAVILFAYALGLVLYAFVPFAAAMLLFGLDSSPASQRMWEEIIRYTNPMYCVVMLASGQFGTMDWSWLPCVLMHLAASAVIVFFCGVMLRRVARREGEGADVGATPPPGTPAALPAIIDPVIATGAIVQPLPQAAPIVATAPISSGITSRTVSDHPVLWRECRRPLMTKLWQRIAGSIVTIGMLVFTYFLLGINDALDDEEVHIGYACIFHGLLLLVATVLSATTIAQEKESDTWTVLLASPLSGWSIVTGKLVGTLRRLMWPYLLIVAHFLVFTIAGVLEIKTFLFLVTLIALCNLPFVATGMYLSLRIPKVTFAVVVNLAIPIVLYVAAPILLLILGEIIAETDDWVEQMLWYLPFYWLGESVNSQGAETVRLEMLRHQVGMNTFYWMGLFLAFAHLVTAAAVLRYTIARFDPVVGRTSQRGRAQASTFAPRPYNALQA